MATVNISTPSKGHNGLFSPKTAGGRMPLAPSTPTPKRAQADEGEPLFITNFSTKLSRSIDRASSMKHSPKSNIAKASPLPRRLDTASSKFTLIGTGLKSNLTPLKSRRETRPKPTKTTTFYNQADRFIPNRNASEGLTTSAARLQQEARPKSSRNEGSSILSSHANAFNVGGRASADDVAAAMDNLDLNDEDENSAASGRPSPDTLKYQSSLAAACGVSLNTRILAFQPAPPESSRPVDLRAQYNRPLKPANAIDGQRRRYISKAPDRVLDAPLIVDDFYLNILDWSLGNQVAIGLERSVYVWSPEAGDVQTLLECDESTYVSSVKWSNDGHYVGIGLGTGEVQLWDVEQGTRLRTMLGNDERVGVLGWNKHILSAGTGSGTVYNHDVRIAQHKVAELVSHQLEVCGLEWRADGLQLATGGNDNMVSIWDARSLSNPKFTKTQHNAAVKAVSWCPWQPNLLATGGGSADRHIHFWNSTTGARTNSIDTGSQVTSLRWSPHHKEIASTGGFPDNSISLWSYPTLYKIIDIPAHDSRVLHSTISPDGQMLATAAADESLKFWKVWEKKDGKVATKAGTGIGTGSARTLGSSSGMGRQMTIR